MKKTYAFVLSAVLLVTSGCCSNYGVYVHSMEKDLQELRPMVEGYVLSDTRLSDADRKARLSVLDEMDKKTAVAKKDVE